ncbi:hypothetical protein K458DRAFT_248499, partial [Lentithecium fluviatile CBS 122367]
DVKLTFIHLDLLDNSSVRKVDAEINAIANKIDVLINNTAVAAMKEFSLSKDWVEAHFAANYRGYFLPTNMLSESTVKANGIAINVSSGAYRLAETIIEDPKFN